MKYLKIIDASPIIKNTVGAVYLVSPRYARAVAPAITDVSASPDTGTLGVDDDLEVFIQTTNLLIPIKSNI